MSRLLTGVLLMPGLGLAACADQSPLAGGDRDAEAAALIAIDEAFAAGDCASVESRAANFVATTDLRLHAVTTLYGRCRYRANDDAGAVELLARVAYAEPADGWVATALYWLAQARSNLADASTAASDLERFRARFSHDSRFDDATYHLGKAHLAAGDADRAIADFAEVLALPNASELRRAGATYETGVAFVARAEGDPASPDLEAALTWFTTTQSDFATSIYADNAAYRAGRVRYDQGRWVDAEALLVAALDAWPDSAWRPSMAWFLGSARYQLDHFAPAIEALAVTLADPTSVYYDNALYYTGRSWYRQASADAPERFTTAVGFFARLLAERPDSVYADDAAYFAARAHFELEDLDAAETAFALIPERFPASPYVDNAWHYLVLVRVALGDCDAARTALAALEAMIPPSSYASSTRALFLASCQAATP